MSNVTSSSYPVITVSKDGDQFLVVQNGQLKKLTRAGLGEFIQKLAPNTLLSLSDTPNSFVGQQGKGLVVNATEDAMEFAPTTSSNWLALTDTPSSYDGEGGKHIAVNGTENALEFIDNAFIGQIDTPATYAGQAGKVLKVNPAGTGIEFSAPVDVTANLVGGFFDYNHGGGTQSYTGGSGYLKLLNDAAGPNTNTAYPPPGVTSVWDSVNSQFDFNELALGDTVDIRIDMEVTSTAADQLMDVDIFAAVGEPEEYQIPFVYQKIKTAGIKKIARFTGIYMGDEPTRTAPMELRFTSPNNATIKVNGWYVRILKRGLA